MHLLHPDPPPALQLCTLGLTELVAGDKDDYENIAVKLGLDAGYRQAIRNRVWERRINSPLFNVRIYAKVSRDCCSFLSLLTLLLLQDLEDLFYKMWDKFRKGEKASHITS